MAVNNKVKPFSLARIMNLLSKFAISAIQNVHGTLTLTCRADQ